jgi:pre-rRNA-processing protein IPI3
LYLQNFDSSNKAQLLQAEMEVEKLKLDCTQSMQMLQRWKKMYDNLHEFCEDELLDGDDVGSANQILT